MWLAKVWRGGQEASREQMMESPVHGTQKADSAFELLPPLKITHQILAEGTISEESIKVNSLAGIEV